MPLRALLIGINDYHPASSVRPLRGCHNDVMAMHQFLYERFRDQIPDDSHVRVLLDQQADRQGVVSAFREHLAQAGPDDTALVYYSGHGSYGVTAAEFQSTAPDRQEEGWVLYDSRCEGGYDLADKEIALLLERVAARGAHVVVIADSCHSGSVTRSDEAFRGWQPRFISGTREPRPLATYLDGEYLRRREATGLVTVPDSRHFLLSACDKTELAWESDDRRGVFTKALIAALRHSGGSLSYADLYAQACASVRTFAQKQTPRAEALGGFNPQSGFLGRPLPPGQQRRYALHGEQRGAGLPPTWTLDLGAAQGLASDMSETLRIEIFDQPSSGQSLGTADLAYIGATSSALKTNNLSLNTAQTYWAVPLALPLPPFMVHCPDRSGLGALEEALKAQPESPVLLSDDSTGCLFSVKNEGGNLVLHETRNTKIVHGVEGSSPASAAYLLAVLDRLAHWHRILNLQNRRTQLPQWAVRMQMQVRYGPDWQTVPGGESVTLPFRGQRIGLRLLADNLSGEPLYLALVYLSPRYGMKIWWSSTAKVPDGQTGLTMLQDNFFLPEGIDEEVDHLKLIASTEPIEPTAFPSHRDLPRGIVPLPADISGATRSIGGLSEPDWCTRSLSLRIVREQPGQALGEQPLSLAEGRIRIQPHPVFRAKYALEAQAEGSRGSNGGSPLDSPFFRENPHFRLLPLASGRSGEVQPVFLDIVDIENDAALAEEPLVISVKNEEAEEELTLPFWFDGENCLPAGELVVGEGDALEVHVRQVPEEHSELATRGVGKAFRLFFFKIGKELGLKVNIQYLRWVEYLPDGKFERHREGIRERVLAAKKVILIVHGIIGDSKTSVPPFRRLALEENWLVLTYDYENLNTPIEETTKVLKTMLLEMGFAPDDGREVVVVAQSMGGLVARYFIEKLGGHELADRLILTGTASKGSPLGNIADYLHLCSTFISVGMKYFSWSLPALGGLVSALQFATKKLFFTLRQHQVGAQFLDDLNAGATNQPPIPYYLVSADLDEFLRQRDDLELRDKVLRQTGRWFFKNTPNDGAVSRDSAFGVPGADVEVEVGHHMRYYEESESAWERRIKGEAAPTRPVLAVP